MFTKKIPITEPLENHINSSSDSNGEDSSFEDPDEFTYVPPSIDDIKFKHQRFSNYQTKTINRKKELEDDKTGTMWKSVYYTFFNNQKANSITLSELELRCKFLFNMDKYDNLNKGNVGVGSKIPPFTNAENFIKTYSQKKEDNLLVKIFKKKKNHSSPHSSTKNMQKQKERINYKSPITTNNYTFSANKENDKKRYSKSIQNTTIRPKMPTLLELYDLFDSNDLVEAIKKEQKGYIDNNNNFMLDNLSNIIENKHTFMNEVNKIDEIFEENISSKNKVKNIINVTSTNNYFSNLTGIDMNKKFENELEPQNNMSRQVNSLYNKLLTKLNPLHKIII